MTLQHDANHQVAAPCNMQPSNQTEQSRNTNSNVPGKLDRDVAVAMDHLHVTDIDQMLTVDKDQGPPASYCAMDVASLDISSAIVLLHYVQPVSMDWSNLSTPVHIRGTADDDKNVYLKAKIGKKDSPLPIGLRM